MCLRAHVPCFSCFVCVDKRTRGVLRRQIKYPLGVPLRLPLLQQHLRPWLRHSSASLAFYITIHINARLRQRSFITAAAHTARRCTPFVRGSARSCFLFVTQKLERSFFCALLRHHFRRFVIALDVFLAREVLERVVAHVYSCATCGKPSRSSIFDAKALRCQALLFASSHDRTGMFVTHPTSQNFIQSNRVFSKHTNTNEAIGLYHDSQMHQQTGVTPGTYRFSKRSNNPLRSRSSSFCSSATRK